MAVWRKQFVPGTPYPDSGKTNNYTIGRHTYFGNLWVTTGKGVGQLIGGMQAFSVEENNNTTYRASAGSDWLEPVFGMREWNGQGSRFQIRGHDLQEIMHIKVPNALDIDFRFLPLSWQYTYNYKSVTNNTDFENMVWMWATSTITRYRWSFAGPMELISEDFNFISKGYQRIHEGGKDRMSNPNFLWGSGVYYPDPNNPGHDPGSGKFPATAINY